MSFQRAITAVEARWSSGRRDNQCLYILLSWMGCDSQSFIRTWWLKKVVPCLVWSAQAYACTRRIESPSRQALPLWGVLVATPGRVTAFLFRPFVVTGVADDKREEWSACSASSKSSSMDKTSSHWVMAMVKKNLLGKRDACSLNTSSNAGSIHLYPGFDKFSLLLKKTGAYAGGYWRLKTFASVVCLLPISPECAYRPNGSLGV